MKVLNKRLFLQLCAGYASLAPEKRRSKLQMDGSLKLTVGFSPFQKTIATFDSPEDEQDFIDSLCSGGTKEDVMKKMEAKE